MQNFFLPEINGLLGVFLIVLIFVFVLKEVKNRRRGKVKVEAGFCRISVPNKWHNNGKEHRNSLALSMYFKLQLRLQFT